MAEKEVFSSDSLEAHHDASTTIDGVVSLDQAQQLQRGLKSRHIQFLALGGAIGTGLFVGSGGILALVGPVPLWLGYLSMMLVVWVVMNVIAEMTTYLPMKGITLPYFTNRYVDGSLAFASGWNYWYAYAVLVAAEASAGTILLEYWHTPVPSAVWITLILLVCLALNIIAVDVFGEAEFWFASIKLITILGLIIAGIVIMAGGAPAGGAIGFSYWSNPGAFKEYVGTGATGRFTAYWTAFIRAGFSFITSPELIGLAAGETVAPRRNIPKAARRFLARLAIFYGVSSLIVGALVPYTDERLLSPDSNANASPWVIGIQRAGIEGLNHAINAAILTSAWSAGNAFLYSGSRVLYSLAATGQAPAVFARTTRRGVPYAAVLATWIVGLLAYLNVSENGARVFGWFMNISTISGFIAWVVVMVTYLRFRAGMESQGLLDTLPFRTPLQPYATWFVLGVVVLLTVTNGFQVFAPSRWNYQDFLAAYITIPVFLVLYGGHKVWARTPFWKRAEDIDVLTGKKEMDEFCEADVAPVAKNWVQKVWFWVA
ncbi:amino acid permease/ SLC12A domain-containing protein [Staphylotrichum tortipilum]|uniref:Amino acid permease/ SLC12A domain-containing protein n=1 Tax=Staphylotrichum tortipilum TaxID=2831512 RepID=A0AAN6MEX2_9PEZI|nr:amino acid permease/ SLC12A domain-containing protein [Staphylotrichum longicolle]